MIHYVNNNNNNNNNDNDNNNNNNKTHIFFLYEISVHSLSFNGSV